MTVSRRRAPALRGEAECAPGDVRGNCALCEDRAALLQAPQCPPPARGSPARGEAPPPALCAGGRPSTAAPPGTRPSAALRSRRGRGHVAAAQARAAARARPAREGAAGGGGEVLAHQRRARWEL